MTRYGNKYGAVKVRRGGEVYDSQAEAGYADVLELLKRGGVIADYMHHPPAVKFRSGIMWRVDYIVTPNTGVEYYVEVKGLPTADYRLKLELWRHEKPYPLFVVRKYGEMRFRIIDEIDTDGIARPLLTPAAG